MTENGLPPESAAPSETPAPEAPQVEDDRLARLEGTVERLAGLVEQGLSRATPPTTDDDPSIQQAEELRRNLEAEAQNNPALRTALSISQGLYNHMQAQTAQMQRELDLLKIKDEEERELTEKALATGEFNTVAAARRAVKGDLLEKRPAKPEPKEARQEDVERVRGTDASPRGVGAPEFKRRMNDKDYASKVGDPNLPMEERVKLRRERAGIH